MTTLLLILWVILIVGLVFITAVRPARTNQSLFELKRKGNKDALKRERLLNDIFALRRAIAILFVVAMTVIGWTVWQEKGVIVVLLLLPGVMIASRWSMLSRPTMQFYRTYEKKILSFVDKWSFFGWILGSERREQDDLRLESEEQLVYLIESASDVLSEKQKDLIKRSLSWHTTPVSSVMTLAEDIVSIKKADLLGPLVLDDLHKSGYHKFPVIRTDINHVIGMVNITELLRVDAIQKSQTAEKAMTPMDVRLDLDTELPDALEQLLENPGQLGIVTDNDKTVGLVTVSDVLGVLLGTKHR